MRKAKDRRKSYADKGGKYSQRRTSENKYVQKRTNSNQRIQTIVSNDYYDEYRKVAKTNKILTDQYTQLKTERDQLTKTYEKLQKLARMLQRERPLDLEERIEAGIASSKGHQKRERRLAVQIARDHRCPVEKCGKAYGTVTALNMHIKLKHPGFERPDKSEKAEKSESSQ